MSSAVKIGMPFRNRTRSRQLLILGAVPHLPDHREQVRGIEPAGLFIESACGTEVGQPDLHPGVLEPIPQHLERAAPLDLGRHTLEESVFAPAAVVLGQPLPLLWLCGQDKVHHVARQETERAVVVLRAPLAVTAGGSLAVGRWCLANDRCLASAGIGAVPQQAALDRVLEGAFGDLGTHAGSPGSAIGDLPRPLTSLRCRSMAPLNELWSVIERERHSIMATRTFSPPCSSPSTQPSWALYASACLANKTRKALEPRGPGIQAAYTQPQCRIGPVPR